MVIYLVQLIMFCSCCDHMKRREANEHIWNWNADMFWCCMARIHCKVLQKPFYRREKHSFPFYIVHRLYIRNSAQNPVQIWLCYISLYSEFIDGTYRYSSLFQKPLYWTFFMNLLSAHIHSDNHGMQQWQYVLQRQQGHSRIWMWLHGKKPARWRFL